MNEYDRTKLLMAASIYAGYIAAGCHTGSETINESLVQAGYPLLIGFSTL